MSPLIKTTLRGIGLIFLLSAMGFAVQSGGLGGVFNQDWIDENVRGAGVKGNFIFLIGAGLFIAVGLPRQIVSFLGGYAFGLLPGTGLALVATALGCVISFTFARFMGRELVSARLPAKLRKASGFLEHNSFAMALLIRLLPLGSNLVTNLAAGISSVSATGFLAGSIGIYPADGDLCAAGQRHQYRSSLRITSSVLLFVISAALGIYPIDGIGKAELDDGLK